jgi:hypothetical protein
VSRQWLCRAAGIASVALIVATVASCAPQATLARPDCQTQELRTLSLIAQSVHDATMIPCLNSLQAGWSFEKLEVQQDHSEMVLASDRAGEHALRVTLTRTCDIRDAVRIPSDEPQTERYENILQVQDSYRAIRSYVFAGGCVTYRFQLTTERPSVLLNEATLMVGFIPRAVLREAIERDTDGLVKDGP